MGKVLGGLDRGNLVKSELEVGSEFFHGFCRLLAIGRWKMMEMRGSKAWESCKKRYLSLGLCFGC